MKSSLVLIISIIVAISSSCKTEEIILHGEICGYVTDEATIQPLLAAKIKLNPTLDSTKTGSDGKYLFKNLTPGNYEIKASKFPYGTIIKTAAIIAAKTQEINFALNAVPVPDFSEKYLDFGLDSTSLSFIISNKGVGEMSYVITASQDWITVHPSMGTITDEADKITVTINKTGVSDTIHREKIKIISIVGEEVVQKTVEVLLNGAMDSDLNYYPTVRIGTQVWMAKSLNVGTYENYVLHDQTDNGIMERYCRGNSQGECDWGGGLYLWDEMMQYNPPDNRIIGETQGICPVGWHIPTEKEWVTLIDYLGGLGVAGGKLKSTKIWEGGNVGATDEVGFHARPGEFVIYNINMPASSLDIGIFWTASNCNIPNKWCRYVVELRSSETDVRLTYVPDDYNKDYAYSVRCVKDPTKK